MSLVPTLPSPLSASPSAKTPFKDSIWRPIIAMSGALGVGLLTAPLFLRPMESKTVDAASPTANLPELVMQSQNTLIVQPSMPPGALLRGQIKLVADMTGKAPVGGAVARQLVDPGTRVKQGDPVLEISSGRAARPAPAAEAVQTEAERRQVAAADAQLALRQRMNLAQTRLRAAQERVDRAQTQVSSARDLVRRLQNGEAIAATEIPAPFRDAAPVTRRSRRAQPTPVAASTRSNRQALRDNTRALISAKQALADAQKSADTADDNLKTAQQNVTTVEARSDQKKASGADVALARGAQKDAEAAVNTADRAMIRAKLEVTKLEEAAETLKKTDSQLNVPDPAPENDAPSESEAPNQTVTLDQAIKFAGAALDESRRASREAERLHTEIDDYQRQVKNSKSRIETATQALSTAQQEVLDSVPRPRFTSAVAPADGIVTWVSRLAREVGAGQSVFGIARGTKVAAQFEDKEGLWRGLKPGASLSAIMVTAPAVQVASSGGMPQGAPTLPKGAGGSENPTVAVKVTEIVEPETEGQAATVSAEVLGSPSGNGTASPLPSLPAGTEILAAVARPGQKPVLSVPTSALMKSGGTTYLAVLAPVPGSTSEKENKGNADSVFLLRWQPVKTGRADGIRQEIVAGLVAGTRVVASLNQLEEMGLTPEESALPVASSAPESSSQDEGTEQIAVRLTTASA